MKSPVQPLVLGLFPLVLAFGSVGSAADFSFAHPGLLHSREDLARIKRAVAEKQEPVFAGFEKFRTHPASQPDYVMRGPAEEIGRSPMVNFPQFDSDANASYQCALMWCLTGERAYADKAKQILNAWSARLQRVSGADAVLMAGLGPFKMINAAELILCSDAGWSDAEVAAAGRMFRQVIYPTLKDFAPFANGNWDTAAIKTVLAIGVFCDDRAIFERGLRYYVNGAGDGRLTHYIINEAGQCQESGRDMQHTQLGLAHLGDASEIAWQQGLDLYGYAGNRLLQGFEYTAKYNLGAEVPFVETLDRTGRYHHTAISAQGRGNLRAVFEQIYHHYVNRAGLVAPWTQQAAERIRPEGPGRPGADHPGFGTLLYTRPRRDDRGANPTAPPASPGAVVARGARSGNNLTWVPVIGAASYIVKRAEVAPPLGSVGASLDDTRGRRQAAPLRPIVTNVRSTKFADRDVAPGALYTYAVSAVNSAGESPDALATTISAGLPGPWKAADVGAVAVAGETSYDGGGFVLEGAGAKIGGAADQFQFAHVPLIGDGTIVVRFVPQVSSQFSQFGVMLRESLAPGSAGVAALFTPDHARERERPGWGVQMLARAGHGAETAVVATSAKLDAPQVTYGRLVEPCWLRVERRGDTFTAAMSADGKSWNPIGTSKTRMKREILIGLAACSGLTSVTTTVRFDHVSVPGWKP